MPETAHAVQYCSMYEAGAAFVRRFVSANQVQPKQDLLLRLQGMKKCTMLCPAVSTPISSLFD